MILKKCTMRKFSEYCEDKKIACYGIGAQFERIIKNYESCAWEDKICCLVDNSPKKKGTVAWVKDRAMTILSLEQFLRRKPSEVVIFITCTAFGEIVEQLNRIPALDQVECFIFHFMYSLSDGEYIQIRHTEEMLIPPVIHYCWFGGKELPDLYKRCIESWHKYCPEYEIKQGKRIIAIQEISREYQRQKTNQCSPMNGSARKPQQYLAEAGIIT